MSLVVCIYVHVNLCIGVYSFRISLPPESSFLHHELATTVYIMGSVSAEPLTLTGDWEAVYSAIDTLMQGALEVSRQKMTKGNALFQIPPQSFLVLLGARRLNPSESWL